MGTQRYGVLADTGAGFSGVHAETLVRGPAACLFGDADDRLWICSESASFVSAPGNWGEVEEVDALKGRDIRCVTQTSDGDMWFGTWVASLVENTNLASRARPNNECS